MKQDWEVVEVENSSYVWVKVLARIRKNKTGEIRNYYCENILEEGEEFPNTFIWEDGNYACDCNRELFFLRALNESDEDSFDNRECSNGDYSIQLINPRTNVMYYAEFFFSVE